MSSNFNRRDFLRWASAGAGAAAVGGGIWQLGGDGSPAGNANPASPNGPATTGVPAVGTTLSTGRAAAPITPAGPAARRLVVIELGGGNDGLSTLAPLGLPGYGDLRTATALESDALLWIDDDCGFHPSLGRLHSRGMAAIQGVGAPKSDGSHFEMLRRWWAGDADGSGSYDTGFLGRLADAIGDPAAPATALSIGSGASPALISKVVSTLALPSADAAGYLTGASSDDLIRSAFQRSFHAFSADEADGILGRLRRIDRQTAAFAESLFEMNEGDDDSIEYPGSTLGNGLRLAAALASADNGIRIIHLPMGSDFDTHENHSGRQTQLLDEFDAAVDAFLSDLERRGIADQVLVMTTSEFGRRASDKGADGLDHGTASTALLLGPVVPGRHGEHPSLTELDADDNLVTTLGLDSYYATIAEGWFDVPASELFEDSPEVLSGVFA